VRGGDARTEALCDATLFTENRERLIAGDIAATCRGRRREILSESRMLGNPHVRFDKLTVGAPCILPMAANYNGRVNIGSAS
jgi:hypothetical protein